MTTFNEIFVTLNAKPLPVQGRKCLVRYDGRMVIGRMLDTKYFDVDGDYQSDELSQSRFKTGIFLCLPRLDYSCGGNYFSLHEFPHGMSVYFKTA